MGTLQVSIKNPCSEKWDNFEKKGNVGFCSSCRKNVIDFTKLTDTEILEFFKKDDGQTCGRFKEDQLKVYHLHEKRRSFNRVAAVLAAGLLTLTQAPEANAQKKVVTGKVLDAANTSVPGTNVIVKGSQYGTITDVDGNFELTLDKHDGQQGDLTLVFSSIGLETKEKTIALQGEVTNAGDILLDLDKEALGEVVVVAGMVCTRSSRGFWQRLGSFFRK